MPDQIKDNSNLNKFDFINNLDKVEFLFIMESPHYHEIQRGIPCVWDTGKRMAERIFDEKGLSFGEILKNKLHIDSEKYGIMNSFPFPIGLPNLLNQNQIKYSSLKGIEWEGDRILFFNEIFKKIENIDILEKDVNFKRRLEEYIENSPKIKHLVFCGFIAQAVFLKSYNFALMPHNKLVSVNVLNKEINILFVNHPSSKNDRWDFNFSLF